jgi:hypothetical protein
MIRAAQILRFILFVNRLMDYTCDASALVQHNFFEVLGLLKDF